MKILRHKLARPFIWLWAVALLTATTGVSLHRIYCYCLGDSSLALFDRPGPCAKPDSPKDACCQPKPVSCCAKNGKIARHQTSCGKHKDGCTKKTTRFFQLKEKFTVESAFAKQPAPVFQPAQIPLWVQTLRPVCLSAAVLSNKAPPPRRHGPPSGREIGIRLQTFRC